MNAGAARGTSPAIRLSSSRGRWLLAVTVVGSGMGFLQGTVVNVALPEIGRDLDAGVAGLQWTLNGYLLTVAALILLGGSLGDRYGRRRVFELGVIWFTVTSLLCAVAPSIEVLVAARVLQGVGAALLTPGSLSIIQASLHRDDRARAIGAWSALSGIAGAIGPLLGGYLVEAVTWRAVFLLNVPLGAFVVYFSRRHVPETRDPTATGALDVTGALLAALGLGAITLALIQASEDGAGSPLVVTGAVVGVAALAAFVVAERRSPQPMLPLDIFRSREFTSANLVTFAVYTALGGVFFLLVLFLQVSLGYSAIAAGAASLPVTGLLLLLSARAGALAQRIGPRIPLTIGPLLIAGGLLLMRAIDIGDGYVEAVLPAVVVFGVGLAFVVAPVTATALAAADAQHSGAASGVNNAVSRTAQLVAVAVLPLIAGLSGGDFADPQALADGFHTAMLASAVLALAGAGIAFALIRDDVLVRADEPEAVPSPGARGEVLVRHCAIDGTPLYATSEDAEPVDRRGTAAPTR